jgi:hypothetical protein
MKLQKWVFYFVAALIFLGLSLLNWFFGHGDKSVFGFLIIAVNLILVGIIIGNSFKAGFIKRD